MQTPSTTWLFAVLWFGLAAWQSYRAFSGCATVGGWMPAYWALLAVSLTVPFVAVRRIHAGEQLPRDASLTLVLLTYVPLTIAMRLVESCAVRP